MKKLLSTREVSQILQVEERTIRFWEKEFKELLNIKTDKGRKQRFTTENLELLAKIRELLYMEMYTIKGAKRRLELDRSVGDSLGVEHNFKTTVLFMFSTIMNELQQARQETAAMAEKIRELEKTNSSMERELIDARKVGFLSFFRQGMQMKR